MCRDRRITEKGKLLLAGAPAFMMLPDADGLHLCISDGRVHK
jgi:hypothetical protein